jgi:hypothetical protein
VPQARAALSHTCVDTTDRGRPSSAVPIARRRRRRAVIVLQPTFTPLSLSLLTVLTVGVVSFSPPCS